VFRRFEHDDESAGTDIGIGPGGYYPPACGLVHDYNDCVIQGEATLPLAPFEQAVTG
jgi:hypothetical protein